MRELGWFADQKVELIGGQVVVHPGPEVEPPGPEMFPTRHWTREEYFQMLDLGWFDGHRVELIGGEVLEMAAQFDLHAAAVDDTADALILVFGAGYWVRRQASLDLSPYGVPDPDVSVVTGSRRQAARTIQTKALLVVEASDSSLSYDRNAKGSLYAAAGILDYWIVNLVHRQLEVYRNPMVDNTALHGFAYADKAILIPGDFVNPLALPGASIAVADLLP